MSDELDVAVDESETDGEDIEIPAELLAAGEEDEETEATELEADDDAETPADAADDKATPPTAEEAGIDTSTPEGKKLYASVLATWNKWANRHAAKQKPEPTPAAPQAPERTPQEASGDAWDPYTVPEWRGDPEPEDSVLHGAEADIDRRINAAIKGTMDAMRQNDARLRQQQQIGTAQERISSYAEALQAHPDWEEQAPLVAKIAAGTKDLAINDPDEWIAMVEARTGIKRDWRTAAAESESAAAEQRGQQHQRLARKPIASMPRTMSAKRTAPSLAQRTDMDPDDAFEANWQKMKANGRL